MNVDGLIMLCVLAVSALTTISTVAAWALYGWVAALCAAAAGFLIIGGLFLMLWPPRQD